MNKFEQLIEYVINDEQHKAQELFHDIVVEKSRQIYEDIMSEEEELDEGADEDLEESEDIEEALGGDAADDLIDDVEAEEETDMSMEGEDFEGEDDMEVDAEDDMEVGGDDEGFSMGGDGDGGEAATKDDILNLEDKLDQLMSEFEDLMGSNDMGNGDGFGPEEGGDAIEMDDTEEMGMMEAVSLKAAPKPVTSEEGGVNKKSTVAANAGAKGPIGNSVKPVRAGANEGGKHDSNAYKNTVKDMSDGSGHYGKPGPATKPQLSQAAGVNTKSPVARG